MTKTGLLGEAVIHLHPSLRCNLSCAHCYSSSSPHHRDDLGAEQIVAGLARLADAGYRVLSISGGEPFLYRDLAQVADVAHDLDLKVHVITNGTVPPPRRLAGTPSLLDLVAVSLDGGPQRHDRVRRRQGAFDRAIETIRCLRGHDCRVAVVSCVTRGSLAEIPALYETCAREGVALLALRPVVAVGRGRELLATHEDDGLRPADLLRLKMLAQLLDSESPPRVRADVAFAGEVRAVAPLAYPFLESESGPAELAANINPLVIREDGVLLPFAYGVSDHYALGRLGPDSSSLDEIEERVQAVAGLVGDALATLPDTDDACVDWFDHLLRHSNRQLARPSAAS